MGGKDLVDMLVGENAPELLIERILGHLGQVDPGGVLAARRIVGEGGRADDAPPGGKAAAGEAQGPLHAAGEDQDPGLLGLFGAG